jgi:AraC-like DNA-binding protein
MNGVLESPGSLVWQMPDLQLGAHAFSYGNTQYDGLLHAHREYNIVTCLEGSMLIHVPGGAELLVAGETFVVNPGVMHRCTFGLDGKPSKGLTLLVSPQWLSTMASAMGWPLDHASAHPAFHCKLSHPELLTSAQKIVLECLAMQTGFSLVVELLVKQMLVHTLRAWPRDCVSHSSELPCSQLPWLYMHRATEYMNAYGKGDFRLLDLCQRVGLSSSRFIPLFRNSAQMSPHDYYNHLLVFKAQRLLRNEHCSTKEVAYELGFKHVSHFCSLYHKVTGTTPRHAGAIGENESSASN